MAGIAPLHPLTIDAFFKQKLVANATLMTSHKGRFYAKSNVGDARPTPYIYWVGYTDRVYQHEAGANQEFIGAKRLTFSVMSVREFAGGVVDESAFVPDQQQLFATLCGIGCTAVSVSGSVIGSITGIRCLDDNVSNDLRVGDRRFFEKGIRLEIYQGNPGV
jgi:hypothetical protein